MKIYFFSTQSPDPQMIKDLGSSITTQFRGKISNIQAKDGSISFTETQLISRQEIKKNHVIPAESIVIVDNAPLLQWLTAGVSTLLVCQMKQESSFLGTYMDKYSGLVQVHKIDVVTSPWSNSKNGEDNSRNFTASVSQGLNLLDSISAKNYLEFHLGKTC